MQETEYLHDATLTCIQYCVGTAGKRSLTLTITCHPEAGHPSLNGRALSIRALDVVFMSWTAYGYVLGKETIDEWGDHVSEGTMRQIDELRETGVAVPKTQIMVTFRSGSILELVCEQLEIDKAAESSSDS